MPETRPPRKMRQTELLFVPLADVCDLHPVCEKVSASAGTDYLLTEIAGVSEMAARCLLLHAPILVVRRGSKWLRIAGLRSYQLARLHLLATESIPVIVLRGRVPDDEILRYAVFDVLLQPLLLGLAPPAHAQIDRLIEQLMPGYRHAHAGRPKAGEQEEFAGLAVFFRDTLSTVSVARLLGTSPSTLRRARAR